MKKLEIESIVSETSQPNTDETDSMLKVNHDVNVIYTDGSTELIIVNAECPMSATSMAREEISKRI